jgi:glycyl-tRNA synthetase
MKLPASIAPYKVCVSPLLKNRPELQEKAREVFTILKKEFGWVMYDDYGNVGKRYRRQDEIGTPWCIVVDFDTVGTGENINPDFKDMVTVRDRDTGNQERVAIVDLKEYISSRM